MKNDLDIQQDFHPFLQLPSGCRLEIRTQRTKGKRPDRPPGSDYNTVFLFPLVRQLQITMTGTIQLYLCNLGRNPNRIGKASLQSLLDPVVQFI